MALTVVGDQPTPRARAAALAAWLEALDDDAFAALDPATDLPRLPFGRPNGAQPQNPRA